MPTRKGEERDWHGPSNVDMDKRTRRHGGERTFHVRERRQAGRPLRNPG